MKLGSTKIPATLVPYFQEYDFETLSPESDADLIIGRVLEHGNRAELRWLFETYPKARIKEFVRENGFRALTRRSFNFWRLILRVGNYKQPPWLKTKSPIWRF
jgi:hypothetical protein